MPKILPMIAAAAISFTLISFATPPAYANRGNAAYRLSTQAEVTGHRVAADVVWSCKGGECVASKATSRAEIVCAKAARELGALSSFSAGGAAFDVEQLAKCNTRAR